MRSCRGWPIADLPLTTWLPGLTVRAHLRIEPALDGSGRHLDLLAAPMVRRSRQPPGRRRRILMP